MRGLAGAGSARPATCKRPWRTLARAGAPTNPGIPKRSCRRASAISGERGSAARGRGNDRDAADHRDHAQDGRNRDRLGGLLGRLDRADVEDLLLLRVREALIGESADPENDQKDADESPSLHGVLRYPFM